jgi:hypothetical protein
LLAGPLILEGQDPVPPSGVGAFVSANLTPGAPAGAYALSDLEHINYSNLHLSVFIPVAPAMGRGGASIPVGVSLDNNIIFPSVRMQTGCTAPNQCSHETLYYVAHGWDVSQPLYAGATISERQAGSSCVQTQNATEPYWADALSTLSLVKADGTQIEFIDQKYGAQQLSNAQGPADRGRVFVTHDGSASLFASTQDLFDAYYCGSGALPASGTVTTRNGTQSTFQAGVLTQVQDRNGNFVTLTPFQVSNGTQITSEGETILDSLGRTTTITAGQGNTATITYPGYGGATRTVGVVYDETETDVLRADQLALLNSGQYGNCGTATAPLPCAAELFNYGITFASANPAFPSGGISQIILPDLNSYVIKYDLYGNVARIELPTGGAFEYDYQIFGECCSPLFAQSLIKEKRVYANKNAAPQTGWVERTTFGGYTQSAGSYPNWNGPVTVQFWTPNGKASGALSGQEVHFLNPLDTDTTYLPKWTSGLEYQTKTYDTNASTVLETKTSTWQQRPCQANDRIPCSFYTANIDPAHDPQLILETTTYGTQTTQTATNYDAYNNPISVTLDNYDGSLIRTTTTSYSTSSGFPSQGSYLSGNLISLPWVGPRPTVGASSRRPPSPTTSQLPKTSLA